MFLILSLGNSVRHSTSISSFFSAGALLPVWQSEIDPCSDCTAHAQSELAPAMGIAPIHISTNFFECLHESELLIFGK